LRIAVLAVLVAVAGALHLDGAAAQSGGPTTRPGGPASAGKPPQVKPPAPKVDKTDKSDVPVTPPSDHAGAKPADRAGEEAPPGARQHAELAAFERQLGEITAASASHSLALTYATIGLIVVSASLWIMVFLQARDLKAAVRAVQESAAGARSAAEATQRALVLTQRATVIAGEPRAVWLRDASDRLVGCRLLVTWHNVGPTPTRNMIAAVAGQASDRPPPRTNSVPKTDARQQPTALGPNAAINSAYVNLPIGLVADILARRAYYLFAGWAEYNDVFDHTPRHRVEFCYWVEFEGEPEADKIETRFHIHGQHNRHCESEGAGAANGATRPPVAPPPGDAVVH
jgi:hypothetical protein